MHEPHEAEEPPPTVPPRMARKWSERGAVGGNDDQVAAALGDEAVEALMDDVNDMLDVVGVLFVLEVVVIDDVAGIEDVEGDTVSCDDPECPTPMMNAE